MKVTCAELALRLMALYRKGGLPDPHGPLAKTFFIVYCIGFQAARIVHSDRKKERIILPSIELFQHVIIMMSSNIKHTPAQSLVYSCCLVFSEEAMERLSPYAEQLASDAKERY